MTLPKNSPFTPRQLVEIDRQAGLEWKKAGIVFCENNGWDWPGNAFLFAPLITPSGEEIYEDIVSLEKQLSPIGINWRYYATFHDGYMTDCFGFDDYVYEDFHCAGIEDENLYICIRRMEELDIKWNGWPDTPSFSIVASEEQILELMKRLEEPIAQWREENGYTIPEDKRA